MIEPSMKESLEKIMKEAGSLLLSFWHNGVKEMRKEFGYVTPADLAVESFLKAELGKLKKADFWAEESGESSILKNGYTWVIDPLDGTTNFAHHIPYFCISVALTFQEEPIVAAIYNPILDEYWYADSNTRTLLNGRPVQVSGIDRLDEAFVGIGLPYRITDRNQMVNTAQILSPHVRAMRHYGAVALDLANVACGRLDAVAFSRLFWWDVAAGALLVRMAGGQIAQFSGAPLGPSFKNCIASHGILFEKLQNLLKSEAQS